MSSLRYRGETVGDGTTNPTLSIFVFSGDYYGSQPGTSVSTDHLVISGCAGKSLLTSHATTKKLEVFHHRVLHIGNMMHMTKMGKEQWHIELNVSKGEPEFLGRSHRTRNR